MSNHVSTTNLVPAKRPRGFAAMSREVVSQIARKGGIAAHSAGTAHQFTPEEARIAGRKGGQVTTARRRAQANGANGGLVGAAVQGIQTGASADDRTTALDPCGESPIGSDAMGCGGKGGCGSSLG